MRPNTTLAAILGLAFLAAVAYGLFYLVRLGGGLFDGVGREVAVVTGVAAAALLLAASIVGNGLHALARRGDLGEQRALRTAAYEQVLRPRTEDPARQDVYGGAALPPDADAQMLLHAGPAVLAAYLRLRRAEDDLGTAGAVRELAHLVHAMRRELGHRAPDVALPELAEVLRPSAREREPVR